MPWKETCTMEERFKLIRDWKTGRWPIRELATLYGVSRKTAHKWIGRFMGKGKMGLADLSRAPHNHPNATDPGIVEKMLQFRKDRPFWGPRKLVCCLSRREATTRWPAPSTVGGILKRHGLVRARRRRRRTPSYAGPRGIVGHPNDCWSVDFKGWFLTGRSQRVDPLTIADWETRFLIRCDAVRKTNWIEVKKGLELAFREYGLPRAIRSDNGAPFASVGLGGLSRLSVWWIRLGIIPERIRPGHPEENGRHERMHRSLLEETAQPPADSLLCQKRRFSTFQHRFNGERPHEALGMVPPGELYRPSDRQFPSRLPELEYSSELHLRRVRTTGAIKWHGDLVFLSETLVGEVVGLKQIDDITWALYFGPIALATIDSRTNKLRSIGKLTENCNPCARSKL